MAAPDVEGGLRPLSGLTFDVTVEIPKGQKNKYEVDHETEQNRKSLVPGYEFVRMGLLAEVKVRRNRMFEKVNDEVAP